MGWVKFWVFVGAISLVPVFADTTNQPRFRFDEEAAKDALSSLDEHLDSIALRTGNDPVRAKTVEGQAFLKSWHQLTSDWEHGVFSAESIPAADSSIEATLGRWKATRDFLNDRLFDILRRSPQFEKLREIETKALALAEKLPDSVKGSAPAFLEKMHQYLLRKAPAPNAFLQELLDELTEFRIFFLNKARHAPETSTYFQERVYQYQKQFPAGTTADDLEPELRLIFDLETYALKQTNSWALIDLLTRHCVPQLSEGNQMVWASKTLERISDEAVPAEFEREIQETRQNVENLAAGVLSRNTELLDIYPQFRSLVLSRGGCQADLNRLAPKPKLG